MVAGGDGARLLRRRRHSWEVRPPFGNNDVVYGGLLLYVCRFLFAVNGAAFHMSIDLLRWNLGAAGWSSADSKFDMPWVGKPEVSWYFELCKTVCCACFQVAGGGRLHSFRSSLCGGVQPVDTMPAFLRDGLRRRGVEAVGSAAFARFQVLLAAVGGGQSLLRSSPAGKDLGAGPQAAGSLQASSLGFALLAASRADAA